MMGERSKKRKRKNRVKGDTVIHIEPMEQSKNKQNTDERTEKKKKHFTNMYIYSEGYMYLNVVKWHPQSHLYREREGGKESHRNTERMSVKASKTNGFRLRKRERVLR